MSHRKYHSRRGGKKNAFLSSIVAIVAVIAIAFSGGDKDSQTKSTQANNSNAYTQSVNKTSKQSSKKSTNTHTKTDQPFKMTALDVGQGLSILIQCDGHYMLFDGGDPASSSYVVSYLQKEGISRFDYVIASHYDSDHISGLVGVVKNFSIDRFLAPNYTRTTKTYKSLMSALREKNLPVRNPNAGDTFSLGSARVQVVAPNSTNYENDNNYSIAIVVTYKNTRYYMSGDAERESIREILDRGWDIQADVYVAGHHGSSNATTSKYLNAINPAYTIISCGLNNSYGHPHKEVLSMLKKRNIKIYRTDMQQTIVLTSDGNTIQFEKKPWSE